MNPLIKAAIDADCGFTLPMVYIIGPDFVTWEIDFDLMILQKADELEIYNYDKGTVYARFGPNEFKKAMDRACEILEYGDGDPDDPRPYRKRHGHKGEQNA